MWIFLSNDHVCPQYPSILNETVLSNRDGRCVFGAGQLLAITSARRWIRGVLSHSLDLVDRDRLVDARLSVDQ